MNTNHFHKFWWITIFRRPCLHIEENHAQAKIKIHFKALYSFMKWTIMTVGEYFTYQSKGSQATTPVLLLQPTERGAWWQLGQPTGWLAIPSIACIFGGHQLCMGAVYFRSIRFYNGLLIQCAGMSVDMQCWTTAWISAKHLHIS